MEKESAGPFVFAVSGVKNSGKTTMLANIVPLLKREGLRLAVIKHDGHDFEADVPGTDSRRLFDAGADGVAIYSPVKYMMTERRAVEVEELLPRFADYDLVLLEGAKFSKYRKLEIVRRAASSAPVCDPATTALLCTDTDCELEGVPRVAIDDYAAVVRVIIAEMGR